MRTHVWIAAGAIFSVAQLTHADPTPTPCIPEVDCETDGCPIPTPTAASTPPTPTPSGTTALHEVVQGQYLSIGGRWPHRPVPDDPQTYTWVPPLLFDSNGMGNNTFAASIGQGFYEDGMWEDDHQAAEFAERIIFMTGGITAAGSSLESGDDLTRSSDPDLFDFKYTAGEMHIGSALRGGSRDDRFHVVGALNFGSTNLVDPHDCEQEFIGICNEQTRRSYIHLLQGEESGAWVGKRITGDLTPGGRGPFDIRNHAFREDDKWDTVPADVGLMYGATFSTWLDNKRGDYCSKLAEDVFPSFPPHLGGSVANAATVRAVAIAGAVEDSWINTQNVHLFLGHFGAGPGSLPSTPGHFCEDEREGSIVRKLVGIEIVSTDTTAYCCEMALPWEGHPYIFNPMAPCSEGGTETLFAGSADPQLASITTSPERFAGIMRGDSVFGDSFNDGMEVTGYDTDVAHFRDVIRLDPRTEPPKFDPKLPPSDRVGLIYFDAARNTLRVSVALSPVEDLEDWREEQIAWVDVALATDRIDPARDVFPAATGREGSLSQATREEVVEGMSRAGTKAALGTTRFVKPKMEVIVAPGGEGGTAGKRHPVTFVTSNMGTEKPRVFWKREGTGQYGDDARGWAEVPADLLESPEEMGEDHSIISTTIDFAERGIGRAGIAHGQRVHFMVVNPTDGRMAVSIWRYAS